MVQQTDRQRILFFGMANDTSATVLELLLAEAAGVCGVIVGSGGRPGGAPIAPLRSRASSPLPIANPFVERSIVHIAWERGIPAFELGHPSAPEALAALAELRPDVACVACFPRRLPAQLLALPRLGFLNMHPSLLPAHRGPEPLFWTFRGGETHTGVTIHFMDEALDAGDIAAQAPVALPDGISGATAERICATLGGRLMVETLRALAAGALARRPQPPGGSYEPAPGAEDFRIDPAWPARHAFNFMRGTAEWGQPYLVAVDGADLALAAAIGYDAGAVLGAPYVHMGDEVRVQLAPGVLRARVC